MYHFTECGLDNIYLTNGYEQYTSAEGKGVGVHDMDGLHRVIAQSIVDKKSPLTGKEFRFLRIELDLSQKAIGDLMGKTDQMIAKWEKGESDVPVLADAALRNLYSEKVNRTTIGGLLEELQTLDRQMHENMIRLEETENGWKLDRCA